MCRNQLYLYTVSSIGILGLVDRNRSVNPNQLFAPSIITFEEGNRSRLTFH